MTPLERMFERARPRVVFSLGHRRLGRPLTDSVKPRDFSEGRIVSSPLVEVETERAFHIDDVAVEVWEWKLKMCWMMTL